MSLDRGPRNPAGAAFEQARNEREAWRRQQIVALTPEQRVRYDELCNAQDGKLETKRKELRTDEREQKIDLIRGYLKKDAAPELKPGRKQRPQIGDEKRIQDAVPDFVDGRSSPATREFEHLLKPAAVSADMEIARRQALGIQPLQAELQAERDKLFVSFEAARQFKTAANEKSWREALSKAAKDETARDKDRDLTKDFNDRAR